MSSLFDPANPNAMQQMQGLVQGGMSKMVKKHVQAKAKREADRSYARFCPVCSALYERLKIFAPAALKEGKCETCREALKEGYTALVTIGKRYQMVKPNKDLRAKLALIAADLKADLQADDRAFLIKFSTLPVGEVVTVTDEEIEAVMSFSNGK